MALREFPAPEVIEEFYQEEYYRPEDGRRFPRPMEAAVSWFRSRRARDVRRHCPPGGTVLDVGCGRGLILAELKRLGHPVLGTQLSRTAADALLARHGIPVFVGELPDAGFGPHSVDTAVILHVLEHTTDPIGYLRTLHEILRPGGTLLVEVPNAGCTSAVRHGLDWLHWDIPHHLFHFDRNALAWVLEQSGFEILGTRTFSLEYGPFGVIQAWLNRLFPGRRHLFYRTLSGLARPGRSRFLLQAAMAIPLGMAALPLCIWRALRGDGEVLTVWCRRR